MMEIPTKAELEKKYPDVNGFSLWHSDIKIGKNTEKAFLNIAKKLKDKNSRDKQLAKAIEVLSCCNPPYAPDGTKKTGLVVGKVQSGKTTSFTLVSALAADNHYKIVIHLLGTTKNLRDSNYKDVAKTLGWQDGTKSNWIVREVKAAGSGGIDLDAQSLKNLISGNPASMQTGNAEQVIYMPMLKQVKSIECLTDLMKQTRQINNVSVLIIDDEVDAHGMNVSKNPVYSAIEKSTSPTNQHLFDLREACGKVTYLGYTATAQGPIWQHPNNFMSPDFHCLLEPGEGYVGNEELFGKAKNTKHQREYDNHQDWNHQIKEIDVTTKISPTNPDKLIDDELKLQNSLYDSVCNFLVSYVLLRLRQLNQDNNDNDGAISMMVHTTHLTGRTGHTDGVLNHQETKQILTDYLDSILWSSLSSGSVKNVDYLRLKHAFDEKVTNCNPKYAEYLPSFEEALIQVKKFIDPHNQNVYQIQEVNGRVGSIKDVPFDNAEMWFLVGGRGLARGFVIEGLLTTWMPIQPGNIIADTMEQRGRFFGYKQNYLDLISVYLKGNTMEAFRGYISDELSLWTRLQQLIDLGKSLAGSDPYFVSSNALSSPTAKNKMRRPVKTLCKDWVPCKTLPFVIDNKINSVGRFEDFYQITDKLVSKIHWQNKSKHPQNNIWNANTQGNATGQEFQWSQIPLDQMYDMYLSHVSKLDDTEYDLKTLINQLKAEYCGVDIYGKKRKNLCDVVLFKQGTRKVVFDELHAPGKWAWPSYGYTSGVAKSLRNIDPAADFCGDDKVILGDKFNPFHYPGYDEDHNYNTTVQIHEFDSVNIQDENGTVITECKKPFYAVRIKMQHGKVKIIRVAGK